MRVSFDRFTVHPRTPFRIARSSTTAYDRIRVRLLDDAGHEGWGEAAPNVYYKETADTVEAALSTMAPMLERITTIGNLLDIDVLEERLRTASPRDASARAAVSAAAHDLLGKKLGQPVFQLFDLDPLRAPPSSFTIAISTNEDDLLQRIDAARSFPILKIKLGSDRDEWIVRTLRRALPRHTLRADANAGWDLDRAIAMTRFLADHGFELVEQPVPPGDAGAMRKVTAASPIPVIADESCLTATDVPRLDGVASGINIKLSKCGGLAEARRMALEASRRGMRVMFGCMVESSLGISAAAHLAPLAQYADLDGAALLADDPFDGIRLDMGMLRFPNRPGLGVVARS